MLTALAILLLAAFWLLAAFAIAKMLSINGRDPADDEEQAEWIARWAEENDR